MTLPLKTASLSKEECGDCVENCFGFGDAEITDSVGFINYSKVSENSCYLFV